MRQTFGARTLSIALATAALLTISAQSHAQSAADVASARDLFKEAAALGQKGDWEGARKAYAKSLELKRATITLYSIGVAEKSTGHMIDALEHFRAFLAEPSTAGTQPYEQPARDAITELAKRVGHILLKIEPSVAPAHVTIDGVEVPSAALELPRMVDPGSREIIVTAPGYITTKQVAVVAEGASTKVTLKLAIAPPGENAPIVLAPIGPNGDSAPLAPRVTPPNRTLPIALIGGGGALLVVGVIVGMIGVSEASSAPTKDGPEASTAKTKALIGDVVGGAGIVAAGIGVFLFATAKPKNRDAAWSISPWASGDTAGLRLRY